VSTRSDVRAGRRSGRRAALAALGLVLIVGGWPAQARPEGARALPLPLFTLRTTDACFYAPPVPGSSGWPLAPVHTPHPIRGSFNEPRTDANRHFGVDIQALRDSAPVYSIAPGVVLSIQDTHIAVGTLGHYYTYWHVRPLGGVAKGVRVAAHQLIGWTMVRSRHVHMAEWYAPCGYVDPRRPTGALRTPQNVEWPRIGPIRAFAAYANAFIPLTIGSDPAGLVDPDPERSLTDLRGKVDFRASITDMPVLRMRYQPQIPLMVAAIRGYLAPATNRLLHIGPIYHVYDGARLFNPTAGIWHAWAFGTYRTNDCYMPWHGTCGADYVWHASGRYGIDFKTIPDGNYQFCVQAITINAERTYRCTPITVHH